MATDLLESQMNSLLTAARSVSNPSSILENSTASTVTQFPSTSINQPVYFVVNQDGQQIPLTMTAVQPQQNAFVVNSGVQWNPALFGNSAQVLLSQSGALQASLQQQTVTQLAQIYSQMSGDNEGLEENIKKSGRPRAKNKEKPRRKSRVPSNEAQLVISDVKSLANREPLQNPLNFNLLSFGPSQNSAATNIPKLCRNKLISCYPITCSRAITCKPVSFHRGTQTEEPDLGPPGVILPIPLAVFIPMPMCMYQSYFPYFVPIPVPIPVPAFIPVPKKDLPEIEKAITDLRTRLPDDPLEAEILLYAEQLEKEAQIDNVTEENAENMEVPDENMVDVELEVTVPGKPAANEEPPNEGPRLLKWIIGVKCFYSWLAQKNAAIRQINAERGRPRYALFKDDILQFRQDELNSALCLFIKEARRPTGEDYSPECIFYICLGIYYFLQSKQRTDGIFFDPAYEQFNSALHEILMRHMVTITTEGVVLSRIEEELLWETKLLGAYSPYVLLHTVLYFNTRYFFLKTLEDHTSISFLNIRKHYKRNIGPNNEEYPKTLFLRYYPTNDHQLIYEQEENYDDPTRCPVKIFEFYFSKCPDCVKSRNDIFYLQPELAVTPDSPVWFSSQPLPERMVDRMLTRLKLVREISEIHLTLNVSL